MRRTRRTRPPAATARDSAGPVATDRHPRRYLARARAPGGLRGAGRASRHGRADHVGAADGRRRDRRLTATATTAARRPDLDALLGRSLLYVTGKGGAGKTTVCAALGVAAAARGRSTVVCELAGAAHLPDAFG